MFQELNKRLKKQCEGDRKIFVLRGFNTWLKNISLDIERIFDLHLEENILNIGDKDLNTIIIESQKLLTGKSFYCLYEEMIFIERNNLIGLLTANNYKLKIIDIGCFDYLYPGFSLKNIDECVLEYDKELVDSNYLQKFYTRFFKVGENSVVAYNIIEANELCSYVNLIDNYSEDYIYHKYQKDCAYEVQDNAASEIFIQLFVDIINGKYNKVVYKQIEGKTSPKLKKLLNLYNNMGVNIQIIKEEKKQELPERYDDYLKILQRIDENYDFREVSIYENPFESNKKIEISQSIIIDTIYRNIEKAQNGESFRDIFVTAPTGAGKSVLFQIPAVMAAEKNNLITIIISPLIGLMKDQVNNIKKITNAAATINSEYTPFQKEMIKDLIKKGEVSILYISPETLLSNNDITTFIGERKIGLLVVDEAHTVATWGKNFRPDYWYLGDYLDGLRHRAGYSFPIATFTATATIGTGDDDMYHDIIESLNMTCESFLGNVKRNDISFNINVCKVDHAYQEEKESIVFDSINKFINSEEKTLVYFPYVKTLNEMYDKLPHDKVGKYYGNLDKLEKDETLEDIRFGNKNVVLATKAFGMGIDVKDIKNVYHFAPTGNLADYVQEIGRAARDPKVQGVAVTDYFEKDFRYINQLYGLSQISNFNVLGVLDKIIYKYKKCNRRNFLISTEEFAHVFKAESDSDIESKLKATIIAIKKDFKNMSNYVPLIFKPRSMFTKGLFFISDARLPIVKSYGWGKYLTKKYSGEELSKLSTNASHFYLGSVYEFDFKKCWEDNYNGKYDGMTFGQFKRQFYNGELKGIDKEIFSERMILTLESKYGNTFEWALNTFLRRMDVLKSVLDDMKMANKRYNASELAEMMAQKDTTFSKTKYKNIMDTILNLISAYDANMNFGQKQFCKYNSQTERYQIDSPYYYRVINKIKEEMKTFLSGSKTETRKQTLINTSKNKDKQMRNDPLLIAVQIMELFDLSVYTCEAGNKPEFFIRVNSEKTIMKVLDNRDYQSRTLAAIHLLHHNSVRYMKYFFEKLTTDEERWQFIEDYFMGRAEENHKIGFDDVKSGSKNSDVYVQKSKQVLHDTKKINNFKSVYIVFHSEDSITNRYYISDVEISTLTNAGAVKLSPDCAAAQKLILCKPGDVFNVNEYEYLVEKIEQYDI